MDVWKSDAWRLKNKLDVKMSTYRGVALTAATRTNSVTMPLDTAGVLPTMENRSQDHPFAADNTAAPRTSPVKQHTRCIVNQNDRFLRETPLQTVDSNIAIISFIAFAADDYLLIYLLISVFYKHRNVS